MIEKVIGYLLVTTGIITITLSAVSVYKVFTRKSKPTNLFSFSGISINPIGSGSPSLPSDLTKSGVKVEAVSQKRQEILPPAVLNDTSNLFAHIIFMGFVSTAGYKIASLGVMLVRPIKVKLKTKKENSLPTA